MRLFPLEVKWREEEYEATIELAALLMLKAQSVQIYLQKHSIDKPSHILSSIYLDMCMEERGCYYCIITTSN